MIEMQLVKQSGNMDIFPKQRVKVWDHLDQKVKPATVIKRYGLWKTRFGKYPDLVDVVFDALRKTGKRLSRGHFTYAVEKI